MATKQLIKTEYEVTSSAYCDSCRTDHFVEGSTALDKKYVGKPKDDLSKILKESYPSCPIKPNAVLRRIGNCYRIADASRLLGYRSEWAFVYPGKEVV